MSCHLLHDLTTSFLSSVSVPLLLLRTYQGQNFILDETPISWPGRGEMLNPEGSGIWFQLGPGGAWFPRISRAPLSLMWQFCCGCVFQQASCVSCKTDCSLGGCKPKWRQVSSRACAGPGLHPCSSLGGLWPFPKLTPGLIIYVDFVPSVGANNCHSIRRM